MPSLQDIESFKIQLNHIGDEPDILAERGEEIEDVHPPEAEDLSSLLDDDFGEPESERDVASERQRSSDSDEASDTDFAADVDDESLDANVEGDDLGDFDIDDIFPADDTDADTAGPIEADESDFSDGESAEDLTSAEEVAPEELNEADDLDSADGFDEFDLSFPEDESEESAVDDSVEEPAPEESVQTGAEDSFESSLEASLADLLGESNADVPATDTPDTNEDAGTEGTSEETTEGQGEEETGFDDDFDLGAFDDLQPESAETGIELEPESEDGEFDLGDFDDSIEELDEGGTEEVAPDGDVPEEDARDENARDEDVPDEIAADEFSFGPEMDAFDLEDYSVGDEEQVTSDEDEPAAELPGDLSDFDFGESEDETESPFDIPDESDFSDVDASEVSDFDGVEDLESADDLGESDGVDEFDASFSFGDEDDLTEEVLPDLDDADVSFDFGEESIDETADEGDEPYSVPDEFAIDDSDIEEAEEVFDDVEDSTGTADAEEFDVGEFELGEPGSESVSDDEGLSDEFSFDDETDSFDIDGASTPSDEDAFGDDIGEDDFDLDDFSLGDIGEDFGITEDESDEAPSEEELNPALAVSDSMPQEADESLDLTTDQFAALQETLNTLPRNLRLIVEELIGEQQLGGDHLRKLVDALVRGRSPKDIAAIAGGITGEKIAIPAQYEKRTGLEFEEERDTFGYLFRHRILPVLRLVGAGLAIVALLTYLGYEFVYQPIRAASFYRRGYGKIEAGSYLPANEDFERGLELWVRRPWFYRYADAFRERRREDLAAEKYEELLRRFPEDTKGMLDYAHLETFDRARYEHAESLLNRLLDIEYRDYGALLLLGDTYMEWASEDPGKYENARFNYATLLEEYGNRDEIMFRMLRYFIRTDNPDEVDNLKNYFQDIEDLDLNPEIYAELGGYLIDRDQLTEVKPILFRAMDQNENIASIHYHLARYFRKVDDIAEEDKALTNTINLIGRDDLLSIDEEKMLIDTIARQGEVDYEREQYIEAQDKFIEALDMYEDALDRGRLTPDPMFGRVYAALGDVFYYIAGQSEPALVNYLEAERNDYVTPPVRYKIGSIRYRDGEYTDALLKFYQAAGDYSANPNLMYATANTLYQRRDYSAAQGYYLHVLDVLESQRRNIPILRPEERSDHRALLENLMRTYNNLGATLYRISEVSGETGKRSQGLAYLTRSSEFFDRLTRDRDTLVRTESKNLSYLNTRAILYPSVNFDVEIYNSVPRDMEEIEF